MPSITDNKAALRARVRSRAAALSVQARQESDRALFRRFLALPQVGRAGAILLFFGVGTEPATAALLEPLWAMGKTLCLPKCLPHRAMEARVVGPDRPLVPGAFGIPEPGEDCPALEPGRLDLLLVPALCYDRAGYRLGQGGGYYDRYLPRTSAMTVGLCRDALLLEAVPTAPHDRRVDLVLTETRTLSP